MSGTLVANTIKFESTGNNLITYTGSNTISVLTTGYLVLPVGNTGQRPAGANGAVRFNSETNKIEIYASGAWSNVTTS